MTDEVLSNLIADIYQVSITLGSSELTKYINIRTCSIYESIEDIIPTCALDVTIPVDYVNKNAEILSDGTKIIIQINTVPDFNLFELNETYTFRLSGVEEIETQGPFIHCIIYGIFDCYKLFEDGNQYNAKANTSEIVCKIAGACGLECDKDGTSDNQLWIAGEKNARDFIKYMAKYGYIDGTSGIFWCVTRNKKLIYKNIITAFNGSCSSGNCNKLFIPSPGPGGTRKGTEDTNSVSAFTYTTISTDIKNGLNNLKYNGYGGKDVYFELKEYKNKNAECCKTTCCNGGGCCNINKELSQGLATIWPGFNFGNTYKQYYQAPRQNTRVLAGFATQLEAYCQFMQPINIADVLNVQYIYTYNEKNEGDITFKLLTGKAMVNSHVIEISPGYVSSYVGLVMQGLNADAKKSGSY
ncbi:MAG: hypothetical protein IKO49_02010 [Bacilli bacterium]|nr:hypothetical protein [Clostridia bacterium]MBR4618055.1 hypothetical protein [Bacilli bacterium]